MSQASIFSFYSILQKPPQPPQETNAEGEAGDNLPLCWDLFCGIGGASEGARMAGYAVVLAVDMCPIVLRAHKKNHPQAMHRCLELPRQEELLPPFPPDGTVWHLHMSPPCTDVSSAQMNRCPEKRQKARDLVAWCISFAHRANCTTWSLEEVSSPLLRELFEELLAPTSALHNTFVYHTFKFQDLGVPQTRRRVLVGPPNLINRLKLVPEVRRSIKDVIAKPRGTHVRTNQRKTPVRKKSVLARGVKYYELKDDDYCHPINGPAPTLLACRAINWANPGTGKKLTSLSPRDMASIQTFPTSYKLKSLRYKDAVRGCGNAVPPYVMYSLLTGNTCHAITGERRSDS